MLLSKSAFADSVGVSAARVSQWLTSGTIHGPAIAGTGRSAQIDPDIAKAQIAARRDPLQSMANGKARLEPATPALPPDLACVLKFDEPADRRAVALGLLVMRGIGASAASLALAAGAPIEVAYTMKTLATADFVLALEGHLAFIGIPTDALVFRPDLFDDLDWPALAAERGLRFDKAACDRYRDRRIADMNASAAG